MAVRHKHPVAGTGKKGQKDMAVHLSISPRTILCTLVCLGAAGGTLGARHAHPGESGRLAAAPAIVRSADASSVPATYQPLYADLQSRLNDLSAYLDSKGAGQGHLTTFGAELLTANSNAVEALLTPQALAINKIFISRLKSMGVGGVTLSLAYPLFTPSFPRYQEYLSFYKKIVSEARSQGLKVSIEASLLFANTSFSSSRVSYASLTFDSYKSALHQMVQTIIDQLHPDYVTIIGEPDTSANLTGLKELLDPDKGVQLVQDVLKDLKRGTTKVGAGTGTWSSPAYLTKLAQQTTIDFVDLHVYPYTRFTLDNALAMVDIARKNNKRVVMNELWLYKTSPRENTNSGATNNVAASSDIFRRDAFDFWQPLDQQFLQQMTKLANLEQMDYISPFWSYYLFSYAPFSAANDKLSYTEISRLVTFSAYKNMVSNKRSATGQFYMQLAKRQPAPAQRLLKSVQPLWHLSSSLVPSPGAQVAHIDGVLKLGADTTGALTGSTLRTAAGSTVPISGSYTDKLTIALQANGLTVRGESTALSANRMTGVYKDASGGAIGFFVATAIKENRAGVRYTFGAKLRNGPDHGITYQGLLELWGDKFGGLLGWLTLKDGTVLQASGQDANGNLNMQIVVRPGTPLFVSGTTLSSGDLGGTVAGPLAGDEGDWVAQRVNTP